MPSWMLPLVGILVSTLPGLITQAEAAFAGVPDGGVKKKKFVTDAVRAMMLAIGAVNATLLTKAQQDAILVTVDAITEAIVDAYNTAELFSAPPTV
jgi:hypothetical protein